MRKGLFYFPKITHFFPEPSLMVKENHKKIKNRREKDGRFVFTKRTNIKFRENI